jgi:glycosyltransferase involved in cell wall biosynthesis
MKILIDAIPMTGLLTGIARYLRNLYHAVDRLNLADTAYFNGRHLSDSLPPLADAGHWQQMTRSVRRLPDPVVFALRAARWHRYEQRLNRICRSETNRFSLYHETAFTPARLKAVPSVFSIYDLSLRRYRHTQPKERVWMFEYFIKTRLKYARHMLTISEFIRHEIMDEFKVHPSRVSSIPLAPASFFAPSSSVMVAQVQKKYCLPKEYLLFVSSLEPRKNIDLLIDALAVADMDIPLVLVGGYGWGDKAWLEKINKGRLKKRIFCTGHVSDQDLAAVYTGATALVYPSFYEGFGLPILEAMACGCPVICSNAASMPEAAGNAALYIDPLDVDSLVHAIETLVPDTHGRQTLKTAGLARAKNFTWEKTARQTMDIFQRVI